MTRKEILIEIAKLKRSESYRGSAVTQLHINGEINKLYSELNLLGKEPPPAWVMELAGRVGRRGHRNAKRKEQKQESVEFIPYESV